MVLAGGGVGTLSLREMLNGFIVATNGNFVLVNEAEASTIKGFKVDLIDDWMLDSLGLTETTGLREDFL